jgi:hypothetical protein
MLFFPSVIAIAHFVRSNFPRLNPRITTTINYPFINFPSDARVLLERHFPAEKKAGKKAGKS